MDVPSSYDSKTCIECGRTLALDEFYVKIKATGTRFTRCKSCHNARSRQRVKEHKEQHAAWAREWYERNHEKALESARRYRLSEKGQKTRQTWQESEAGKESQRRKREAGRERAVIAAEQRRAQLKAARGSHTAAEWIALKEAFGYHCLMCGATEPPVRLVQDHIVPLNRNGSNWIDNIQPLCAKCNTRKAQLTLDLRRNSPWRDPSKPVPTCIELPRPPLKYPRPIHVKCKPPVTRREA